VKAKAAKPRSTSSGSDPHAAAWDRAVRLLAARDRTEHDIRTRLKAVGLPADAIDAAVARLAAAGYLDDAAVALRLAQRRVRDGFGSERIRVELTAHGVAEAAQGPALEAARADEVGRARSALAKRHTDLNDPPGRARAVRFLLGRGFPQETVDAVVEWPGDAPDDPDPTRTVVRR